MKTEWKASDTSKAKYVGILEFKDNKVVGGFRDTAE